MLLCRTVKKCRQYSSDYAKYGFIPSPANGQLPMCLICERRLLPDKANRTISYFLSLRDKLNKQPEPDNMLLSTSQVEEEDGLRASYNISFLIAKSGKARTIGEELLLPVVTEVFNTVLHKPATDIIKKSPLSNDAVQRRIDEMGKDTEGALCSLLKTTQFSLHLDESVLPGNEALLLAYVRFIKDEHMVQELLFARELMTDTKEESTFRILKEVFAAKKIPLTNAVGPPYPRCKRKTNRVESNPRIRRTHCTIPVATDGAPATAGSHRGFIAYLKQIIPSILAVHSKRWNSTDANCGPLSETMESGTIVSTGCCSVITAINRIKSKSLNDRLFKKLCVEHDEEYNRSLLHTEVRWLSKGDCLNRFYGLFERVLEFLGDQDISLCENLKSSDCNIAYMTDLYLNFNEMNLLLQGDDLNLIRTKQLHAYLPGNLFKHQLP
ncbi:hypothetical protein M514_23750 [Trichuris suis]|uniref:Zinc finger BED domain-containing protein 5 n=1 Tax=Trichuris suis TaxID=68888 RepID=A0A085N3J4_9BILA|nr:hypothetical protein M514_23750 [Trichuris suis]